MTDQNRGYRVQIGWRYQMRQHLAIVSMSNSYYQNGMFKSQKPLFVVISDVLQV